MDTLLGLGLLVFMWLFFKLIPDMQFHYYMPPEGQEIDYRVMRRDRVMNNLSQDQIKRNTVNGKYNVPKKNGGNR